MFLCSVEHTSLADDDQPYHELLYPVKARVLDYVTRSGDGFAVSTRFATADDFDTVVKFYTEKLGRKLEPAGNRVGVGGGSGPRVSVVTEDGHAVKASGSFLNFDRETPRGIKLVTFAKVTADEQIMLVISRLDHEEYTHIVLTHVKSRSADRET
jgi:hypothetical protein